MKTTRRFFLMILSIGILVFSGIVMARGKLDQHDSHSLSAAGPYDSPLPENELKQDGVPLSAAQSASYFANMDFNRIFNYIHAHPESELALHYGGAFINADGILVLRLTCQDDKCKLFLEESLLTAHTIYESCKKAFLPAEEMYLKIAERISNLNTKIVNNEKASEEEVLLAKRYPSLRFDDQTNSLTILFSEDANISNLPHQIYLSQCRQLFESVIGQFDVDGFELIPQSELIFNSYSSTAYPGQGITVKKNVNGAWISIGTCSLGYRVHYTGIDGTINGFVTCGHGMTEGYRLYMGSVYLGDVYRVKTAGTVDASVIRTTSNITASQLVYYSNSSGGTFGVALDGSGITPGTGTILYKSGVSTYLTSGTLYDLYGDGYFTLTPDSTPIYHYSLLKVSGNIAASGDSGGVAYVKSPSTSFSKAVGIVLGGNISYTFFVKYDNIANHFGPSTY